MIEKFARAGGEALSEFLDLNHTSKNGDSSVLMIAKFALQPDVERRRTSQSGH
jgi:hypothetical protein